MRRCLVLFVCLTLFWSGITFGEGSTVQNPMGVPAGKFPGQWDLQEFEKLANVTLTFKENPDIAKYNAMIVGNPPLPPVKDRIPEEALVLQPYFEIGRYGGRLQGHSGATEAGTSDILSLRHVNLVRISEDYKSIKPDIAKDWEWNDDYTEIIFTLRKGHKWSDGQPFTAADIEFWYNDLVLNPQIYANPPSYATHAGQPYKVEALNETQVKFTFAAPYPGFLLFYATAYVQPFQPKHFYEQYHITYNPDADKLAKEKGFKDWAELVNVFYGNSDWKDVPSPMLKGFFDFDEPTLEAFIVVKDTPNGRFHVPNPYFHQIDTAGNQLPYISEIEETYVPDLEIWKLRITKGQIDYKTQAMLLEDYPLFKENEQAGNYTVYLAPAPGNNQWYSPNTTVKDPELNKIFSDVRFRQALSLAINRDEINELIYLGQGVPQQFVPIDPTTTNLPTQEDLEYYAKYDPAQARKLLDDMGLKDTDGDGFRERLDGSRLAIDLFHSNQEQSPRMHELVRDYWAAVGVRVMLKEVSSDEYRARTNNNDGELATWGGSDTNPWLILTNALVFTPPFGGYFTTGTGYGWASWMQSGGKEGVEPPADIKRLYELSDEFVKYPLDTPESNRIGREIIDIHLRNLWKIGTVGSIPLPIIVSNKIGNFSPFQVWSPAYWAYAYRPTQWYFKE
ncbi:oligopeptide ABC transporter, periplasmic oligopeptide-binding protein [Candidatus Vecturithrix granuli]|uniref:Oligopeptide ABC transporter, periplasmic oligopeptide-binding protein n=1 Tax=Vecturithrix granuli TaxID=1499967 RepID=A0A081CAG6_VECG1|nr:oligopeptide ABC transporter, periplasmic oligopeptide-binding protein [Candidatus Vecturithrix granuli]